MPNALTGDFDAVLQVSGSTVNRILAVMHQNAGLTTDLPTFPHSMRMRVGDPKMIDGMRGTATGQISVPRIDLIHGSTDRFWLEVGIRARYETDPGTTPLPEFINGTVRAQYRFDAIDPTCFGWSRLAGEYLWMRVVDDSVSFSGTVASDESLTALIQPVDETVARARITRLITVLLETQFAATPHKVSSRFRRGAMRSLHVAANRSLVALPIGLGAETPVGNINSVNQDLLEGRDVGVGFSAEAIIERVQEKLDKFRASFVPFTLPFELRAHSDLGFWDIGWYTLKISWTISLTGLTAQWQAGVVPYAGISIGFVVVSFAGQARTQKSEYNWDFDGTASISVAFDSGNQLMSFALLGTPTVHFHGPYGSTVESNAKSEVEKQIKGQIEAAMGQFKGLMTFSGQTTELTTQLTTLVDFAGVRFDEAVFSMDGMIVRGRVALSQRRSPVHAFAAEQDAFSALASWIPGGRVDAFDWSWSWFNKAGDPGAETEKDRFLLRRPQGTGRSNFGVVHAHRRPLPGLDGMGMVCLDVRGATVHPVTGDLSPAATGRHCRRFGIELSVAPPGPDRLFIREYTPKPHDPIGPVAEVAVHRVDGRNPASRSANTLVVFAGDQWNRETAGAIREGVAACSRRDAGLLVLVLFRDGTLTARGPEFANELREQLRELAAPLLVNEDVHGSWSRVMYVDPAAAELTCRLVTPTGGLTWANEGPIDARSLAKALDDHLLPSVQANIKPIWAGPARGTRLSSIVARLDLGDIFLESPCPPPPVSRHGLGSKVVFVQKGSVSSNAALRHLVDDHERRDDRETLVTVIVDGATPREIGSLGLPPDFTMIPDPDGAIAHRAGIRVWPTRLTADAAGIITRLDVGLDLQETSTDSEQAS